MDRGSVCPVSSAASSRLGKQIAAPSVQPRNAAGVIRARKAAEPGSTVTAISRARASPISRSATSSRAGSQNVYPVRCSAAAPSSRLAGTSERRSRRFAPRSVNMVRSPSGATMITMAPVSAAGSAARWARTPARASSRRWEAASRAPTRPAKTTSAPKWAIHAAWLAAAPPGRARMAAGVSLPWVTPSSGLTSTSLITSPQTTTRKELPAWLGGNGHGGSFGPGSGDLRGEADVAPDDVQVDLDAGPAGHLLDAVEEGGADRLAADAGLGRGPPGPLEPAPQHPRVD